MKIIVQILFLLSGFQIAGQVTGVDTLQYNGDASKYINIVVVGDGYTAAQQSTYINDAANLSNYLLNQSPWVHYKNYFNVFAIKVISAQSGATHPKTAGDCPSTIPVLNPTTFLGCSFDIGNIHRLVVPTNYTNMTTALAAFPAYDQVLCLSNSPYYGGSGGGYATSTLDQSSPEVMAHEVGHSFANLADEYFHAGSERPNMTQQSNPTLVKWKNWVGINGIGVFQHCCGGTSSSWYRPAASCKMRTLGNPFCSVCQEAIIEKIHTMVNPVVAYSPTTTNVSVSTPSITFKLSKLMKPTPNTLRIHWKLNGNTVLKNSDSLKVQQSALNAGNNSISVSVEDTISLLKVDQHSTVHLTTVTWNVTLNLTDLKIVESSNRIACSVFPNPASDRLTLTVQNEQDGDFTYQVYALDGRVVAEGRELVPAEKKTTRELNIGNFPPGLYTVIINVNGSKQNFSFVKQ